MGTDVYSGRGIVATVDEFLGVVNGKNKAIVVDVCIAFYQDLAEQAEQNPDDNWRTVLADEFKALADLKKSMPINTIRSIIGSVVEVTGDVSKYGHCYVTNADYLDNLFSNIVGVSGFDLPYIQEVTAWGSSRYNGWDVPKGVACVVFNSEECFVKTLSPQGEAVQKFLGHCDETEWTEMSY